MGEAGFDLAITPRIEFREVAVDRGRPLRVPNALPRLALDRAFARVELPLHLNWSDRGRLFACATVVSARVYELVLRESGPNDVIAFVDGALLLVLWKDLVLPAKVRAAWTPVVTGRPAEEVA